MRLVIFLCLFFCCSFYFESLGQQRQLSASEIKLKLKKLNFLGSVLYVAAHPDDENTRVIAYLANERLAATAYLSMTRGDGGQNLIGPEIRDQLGLIRTQELIAARRIDGGEQFFTRANDFGFSKNYQETFKIWDKQEILSDVVKVIRQYQPDVIITRFPPDERAGHGHHTASAILAQEAYSVAADPNAFKEQLTQLSSWQVKRVFTNTGRWWNTTINETTPGVTTLNVGSYNALLGKSYSEIAAESRTQHKSQGFGSPGRRGDAPEYFELAKGDAPTKDIFDGVNTTWSRVKGGEKVQSLIEAAINEYNEENPSATIPRLLQIRKEISALGSDVWTQRKLKEVNQLIKECASLFIEATSSNWSSAPGEPVVVSFEAVNRGSATVQVTRIESKTLTYDSSMSLTLDHNKLTTWKTKKSVDTRTPYSAPYWLQKEHAQGRFEVPSEALIGKPENDAAATVTMNVTVNGEPLNVQVPVVYKWTDPVKGELWRPFEVTPPVSLSLSPSVLLFPEVKAKEVTVLARSLSSSVSKGSIKLLLPEGWRSEPPSLPFELAKRNEEQRFTFVVTPTVVSQSTSITAVAEIGSARYDRNVSSIVYDHIPAQTLQLPASAKVVRADIRTEGKVIGYIKGAGDETPNALRNLGYEVWEMKNEEVTDANLARLDAVVLGVRALNTNERVRFFMPNLLQYVNNGGTLITQYNTNFDLEIDADKFSPFPLKISRDRVTEENSAVTILNPGHTVLNFPNQITSADFEGWVQERGLYFPNEWSPSFEPLLAMRDGSEPETKGALLVAKYGKGTYIYTGLSFFRELPEGVAGAYKLFANLVSAGKVNTPKNQKVKNRK